MNQEAKMPMKTGVDALHDASCGSLEGTIGGPQTVIGGSPQNDGREWDCQCARCGSSIDWEACTNCGGDGLVGHDCGEDCCCCLYPEDNVVCDICRGECSFPVCISGYTWCLLHPLPGRLEIEPDTPEWFTL